MRRRDRLTRFDVALMTFVIGAGLVGVVSGMHWLRDDPVGWIVFAGIIGAVFALKLFLGVTALIARALL